MIPSNVLHFDVDILYLSTRQFIFEYISDL